MPIWAAILMAVVSTSIMNLGMALQKKGAASLPKIGREEGGKVAAAFFKSKPWLVGTGLVLGGWGLYFASAKFAPLSIIQPALGAGLAVLALFSVFYLREKATPLEWAAFSAMLLGIVFLGLSAPEEHDPVLPEWPSLLAVTGGILALSGAAYVLGKRGSLAGMRTDAMLGIFSGLLIGLGALYIKAMFTFADHDQELAGFGVCLPLVLLFQIMGLIVMQSGFQHGKALVVVPLQSVLNKVVAILGGMAVLAEGLPQEPLKAALRIIAFIFILFGSAALARFGTAEALEKKGLRQEA